MKFYVNMHLDNSRTLSRSHGFLCLSCAPDTAATGGCLDMYFDNLQNPVEYQGHRSKVKVPWVFVRFCLHDTRGQYLVLSKA